MYRIYYFLMFTLVGFTSLKVGLKEVFLLRFAKKEKQKHEYLYPIDKFRVKKSLPLPGTLRVKFSSSGDTASIRIGILPPNQSIQG